MSEWFAAVAAFIMVVIVFFIPLAISWLITCGLVWIATTCFGYEFSWLVGTGIWVVLILLKSIFTSSNNK